MSEHASYFVFGVAVGMFAWATIARMLRFRKDFADEDFIQVTRKALKLPRGCCPCCLLPFNEWFFHPDYGLYCYPCYVDGKGIYWIDDDKRMHHDRNGKI